MLTRRALLLRAVASVVVFPATLLPSMALAARRVGFDELYEREAVLTETIEALNGRTVEMLGYMAPPLKAEARFFVLTRTPLSVCPFCESEAQWPDDIVLVLTEDVISAVPFNVRIRVAGRLDLGFEKDPETGFVSLIRLESADFARA